VGHSRLSRCWPPGRRGRAPSLAGIYGAERRLLGGRSTTVDDDYLRESILDPAEKVVDGYQPIMPTYKGQITEEELMRLISYMKTMGTSRADVAEGVSSGVPVPTPKTEG
jgi:cytochrome c oxidase subunit II